jgi:hypothetical protein
MPDEMDWRPDWARDVVDDADKWQGRDAAHDDGMDLHPWLLSATDLLVSWSPDELMQTHPDSARRGWDRYFDSQTVHRAPDAAVMHEPPQADVWDAEAADLAVDCLYRFVHAVERCDIAAVVECLAPDYHAIENDIEITRDGMRLRLESSLEQWRSESFRVTLTEIPDPMFHPNGILMLVSLQIDFWSRSHARMITELLGRVLWLRPQRDGRWLIAGMAATS